MVLGLSMALGSINARYHAIGNRCLAMQKAASDYQTLKPKSPQLRGLQGNFC